MPYDVDIKPSILSGTLKAPPSKSMLHRAIFCAALAKGKTKITNYTPSNDIEASLNVAKALGATIKIKPNTLIIEGSSALSSPKTQINVHESATTLRLAIPLFCLLGSPTTFHAEDTLIKRPLETYQTLFRNAITITNNTITINHSLKPNRYLLKNTTSSQFISGLLFALPLLENDSTLIVKNPPSKAYIDLTIHVLKHFNIDIQETKNGYKIPGKQTYVAKDITIDGDYSQAAFFLVAGLLHPSITITDLKSNSLQADQRLLTLITNAKGNIKIRGNRITTRKSFLQKQQISLDQSPDLGPILALLLSFANGKSKLKNAKRLKLKESNRLETTKTALNALGANIILKNDTLIIHPITTLIGDKHIASNQDHRIAMTIAIAATLALRPTRIIDAHVVDKSYPTFFNDLKTLGANIRIIKRSA